MYKYMHMYVNMIMHTHLCIFVLCFFAQNYFTLAFLALSVAHVRSFSSSFCFWFCFRLSLLRWALAPLAQFPRTHTHTGRHKQRGTRRRRRIVAAAAALRRLLQFVVDSLCVWTRLWLCLAQIVLALPLPMPLPVSPFNGCVCFEYIWILLNYKK